MDRPARGTPCAGEREPPESGAAGGLAWLCVIVPAKQHRSAKLNRVNFHVLDTALGNVATLGLKSLINGGLGLGGTRHDRPPIGAPGNPVPGVSQEFFLGDLLPVLQ